MASWEERSTHESDKVYKPRHEGEAAAVKLMSQVLEENLIIEHVYKIEKTYVFHEVSWLLQK